MRPTAVILICKYYIKVTTMYAICIALPVTRAVESSTPVISRTLVSVYLHVQEVGPSGAAKMA